METSTAYWFFIYYHVMLLTLLLLGLCLAPFVLLGKHLEKRRPRLYVVFMSVLILTIMVTASVDAYEAIVSHTFGIGQIIRLMGGIAFGYLLIDKARILFRTNGETQK